MTRRERKRRQILRRRIVLAAIVLVLLLLALGYTIWAGKKNEGEKAPSSTTSEEQKPEEQLQEQPAEEPAEEQKPEEEIPEETAPEEKESELYTAEQIPNVEALDASAHGWGQGSQTDDQNRPVSCVTSQEQYGKYQAYFIGDDRQVIYLTFDEGYENGYTGRILDTLKEKDVKAVFFVTKPYAEKNPELVQRMIDEGHEVGNHSVTHPSDGMTSLSIEKQQEEIMGCHNYIKDNFGYTMHLFRYPTGKFSEQSLAVVNNCNYKSVFWSFAYLDYDVNKQPERSAALQKVTEKLHPGAIYLLHAVSETNTDILGDFIDKGKQAGYTFELFE